MKMRGDEFGIWADDGQLERGFYSREEAEAALVKRYSPEDEAHVGECCHDHPSQEHETCKLCNADDDDDSTALVNVLAD
jgi:hypothetical protein